MIQKTAFRGFEQHLAVENFHSAADLLQIVGNAGHHVRRADFLNLTRIMVNQLTKDQIPKVEKRPGNRTANERILPKLEESFNGNNSQ